MSINTQQGTPVMASGFGVSVGGPWGGGLRTLFGTLPCVLLMLFLGLRRQRIFRGRQGQLWIALAFLVLSSGLMACGKGVTSTPATPPGTYTITVTATGSTSSPSIFTVPLTIK